MLLAACDGPPDGNGDGGASAQPPSLVAIVPATSEECPAGGQKVRTGVDANRDGTLQDGEVGHEALLCQPGRALITTTAEPPGEECPEGGARVDAGIDDDGDGILDPDEIDSTSYVCDGMMGGRGTEALVSLSDEPAGENCASGGTRIDAGLDDDGDGVLDPEEVDSTAYACSIAGAVSLVSLTPEPPGPSCAGGGQRVDVGIDDDGDGVLDPEEIDSTAYVCDGMPGAAALVSLTSEPPGANCPEGGSRIDAGLDHDGDGVLDPEEVRSTGYTCATAGITSLVTVAPEPAGVNCADGGQRIDAGLDDDGDGVLSAVEIDETAYVCDGVATVPFTISTETLPVARVGAPYRAVVTAVGGVGGSYSWSVAPGSMLPAGLTLEPEGTPSTGLGGSPTTVGPVSFVLRVTDFFGTVAERRFDLDIVRDLAVTSFVLAPAENGTTYDDALEAVGGSGGGYTWAVVAGALPPGLALSSSTGVISGTPSAGGGSFVVEVTDDRGATRTARVLIPSKTRWVALAGDVVTDGSDEVFVVEVDGATPGPMTRISPANPPPFDFSSDQWEERVQLSPDGRAVAFLGPFDSAGVDELYVTDLRGATPGATVRVNPPLVAGGDVRRFFWAPDGSRLAFIGDVETDNASELYVVSIVDGAPSGPVSKVAGGNVNYNGVFFAPDGDALVHLAGELYYVDLSAAAPAPSTKISPPIPPGRSIGFADVVVTSGAVIFCAPLNGPVYWVDVSGAAPGAPVQVSAPGASATNP